MKDKHGQLAQLGVKLAELAEDLGDVAGDLQAIGKIEARKFEQQARREISELIGMIEPNDS